MRRFALAGWLGVIAAVGVLRFAMRPQADAVAWMWLAGGLLVALAAAAALVQALRARR